MYQDTTTADEFEPIEWEETLPDTIREGSDPVAGECQLIIEIEEAGV